MSFVKNMNMRKSLLAEQDQDDIRILKEYDEYYTQLVNLLEGNLNVPNNAGQVAKVPIKPIKVVHNGVLYQFDPKYYGVVLRYMKIKQVNLKNIADIDYKIQNQSTLFVKITSVIGENDADFVLNRIRTMRNLSTKIPDINQMNSYIPLGVVTPVIEGSSSYSLISEKGMESEDADVLKAVKKDTRCSICGTVKDRGMFFAVKISKGTDGLVKDMFDRDIWLIGSNCAKVIFEKDIIKKLDVLNQFMSSLRNGNIPIVSLNQQEKRNLSDMSVLSYEAEDYIRKSLCGDDEKVADAVIKKFYNQGPKVYNGISLKSKTKLETNVLCALGLAITTNCNVNTQALKTNIAKVFSNSTEAYMLMKTGVRDYWIPFIQKSVDLFFKVNPDMIQKVQEKEATKQRNSNYLHINTDLLKSLGGSVDVTILSCTANNAETPDEKRDRFKQKVIDAKNPNSNMSLSARRKANIKMNKLNSKRSFNVNNDYICNGFFTIGDKKISVTFESGVEYQKGEVATVGFKVVKQTDKMSVVRVIDYTSATKDDDGRYINKKVNLESYSRIRGNNAVVEECDEKHMIVVYNGYKFEFLPDNDAHIKRRTLGKSYWDVYKIFNISKKAIAITFDCELGYVDGDNFEIPVVKYLILGYKVLQGIANRGQQSDVNLAPVDGKTEYKELQYADSPSDAIYNRKGNELDPVENAKKEKNAQRMIKNQEKKDKKRIDSEKPMYLDQYNTDNQDRLNQSISDYERKNRMKNHGF